MEQFTTSALGTTWWIEIFDAIDTERLATIQSDCEALLHSIETRFSRFRTDSYVSQLNQQGVVTTEDVDLHELLTLGQQFYKETSGVFNILIGDVLVAHGYDSSYSFTERDTPAIIGNPLSDLEHTNTTWILRRGQIDLGGIGKGWAIDKVSTLIASYGVTEYLINGGGDIYGTSESGEPITLYLEDPLHEGQYLGTTGIYHQGFAASSPYKRRWKSNVTDRNHLIGEQSGYDGSFIIAKNALLADIMATMSLISEGDAHHQLLRNHTIGSALYQSGLRKLDFTGTFPYQPLD